jgi:hypothetical protein
VGAFIALVTKESQGKIVNPAVFRGRCCASPGGAAIPLAFGGEQMRRKPNLQDESDPSQRSQDTLYDVGYGKPPVAHQFQKGRSGNPAGSKCKPARSRRSKTLRAELIEELGQNIAVKEGGRRRHLPRQTALVKKIIADALSGDAKARAQLIQLASKSEASPDTAESEDLIGAAKDAEILERFKTDVIRQYREENDD